METAKTIYTVVSIIWFSASLVMTVIIFLWAWYSNKDAEFPPDEVQVENIELNEKLFSLINFTAKEVKCPFAYDNTKKEWVKATIP